MGRARDISKVFSTGTALATDTEVSGSYLTLASASTTYQTKASNALVLLNTTSFTTQSTVSIDNVFSSTYDNYRIIMNLTTSSTNTSIAWRARVSGADNSSSNYMWNRLLWNSNATPGTSFTGSGGLTTWGYFGDAGQTSSTSLIEMEVNGMFASTRAKSISSTSTDDGATGIAQIRYAAGMSVTTSYTSISLIPVSGTITGSVSVYGYNK